MYRFDAQSNWKWVRKVVSPQSCQHERATSDISFGRPFWLVCKPDDGFFEEDLVFGARSNQIPSNLFGTSVCTHIRDVLQAILPLGTYQDQQVATKAAKFPPRKHKLAQNSMSPNLTLAFVIHWTKDPPSIIIIMFAQSAVSCSIKSSTGFIPNENTKQQTPPFMSKDHSFYQPFASDECKEEYDIPVHETTNSIPSRPVACPAPHCSAIKIIQEDDELEDSRQLYNELTWRMYMRITNARRVQDPEANDICVSSNSTNECATKDLTRGELDIFENVREKLETYREEQKIDSSEDDDCIFAMDEWVCHTNTHSTCTRIHTLARKLSIYYCLISLRCSLLHFHTHNPNIGCVATCFQKYSLWWLAYRVWMEDRCRRCCDWLACELQFLMSASRVRFVPNQW